MPAREEILKQLERITKSKTFSKTAINVKLLRFLVESSLENREVKEVTIGNEMFGKSYDPIKNDNKVRVYVYHLRKKLDQYYQEEAGSSEIVFSIAKGQYLVQFNETRSLEKEVTTSRKFVLNLILPIVVVFLVAFIVYSRGNKNKEKPFWKQNLNSSLPTVVLIGDHYTISGPLETGGIGVIRDFGINSNADFNTYLQQRPEKVSVLSPNQYSYITKMGVYCSKEISRYFYERSFDFNLMLSSEWDMSMINDVNLVYIGQSKNMHLLQNVLLDNFRNIKISDQNIAHIDKLTGNEEQFFTSNSTILVDYTLVGKVTGPAGNTHKFFLSDHDGGVISSMKYFTNNDSIQAFYDRHKIGEQDFIALFKVTGWERTGYKMKFEWIDIGSN